MLRVLLVDNYDSFTYNLAHAMEALGARVEVRLNDALDVAETLDGGAFDAIVLSPGPGRPEHAGVTPDLARLAPGRVPLLGVCLGHQAIAAAFGARVVAAPELVHGKRSMVHHDARGLFEGVPNPFAAVRYHSWVADRDRFPPDLAVNAWTDDQVVMGLVHRRHPVWGVQFHPESIGTAAGPALVANFLRLAREWIERSRLPDGGKDGKKPTPSRAQGGHMHFGPFNLKRWIDENRDLLKPPVGNKMVWQDADFLVMVVGGPNQRKDFHVEEGEEFFYQVEGDMTLRVIENDEVREIPIREGEIFLLPPRIPHSPQRAANTVGLVIERRRAAGEDDHLRWYCEKCGGLLHDASFELQDLGSQLKPVIERFWANETLRTCAACGTVMQPPQAR